MAGYTRRSSAGIVDGGIISADDLNDEFDALETSMGVGGHTHSGQAGEGPQINSAGLASSSVTNGKIASNAVTGDKIDSTTTITAAAFVGPLTGAITGNIDANSATIDSLTITSGTAITSIDTDLSTVSGADDTLASAKAIKSYVDTQVATADQLTELTDVTVTSVANNEVLAYDTTSSKWINQTATEAGLQPNDAGLTSIAGLTTVADKMIYTTGSDVYATTDLTTFGRSLIDDDTAATARTTLGLGTMATASTADYATLAGATFTGNVSGTNLELSGNLTVNGTTTTLDSTNTVVEDNLLELNSGTTANANDSGIIIERGTTGDNAIFLWDESLDKFALGTTTATADSTGNISYSPADLVLNNIVYEGTADLHETTIAFTDPTADRTITFPDATGTVSLSDTTYSLATSSTLGLVKIGYAENGKNYPVELDSEKMYVNVPWTDTTYDLSGYALLSGATFSGAVSGTSFSASSSITTPKINDNGTSLTIESDTVEIRGTSDESTVNVSLISEHLTPADNDVIGRFYFRGPNNAGGIPDYPFYAKIEVQSSDVSDGTEDGSMFFSIAKDGSLTTAVTIDENGTDILGTLESDGLKIGTGSTVSTIRDEDDMTSDDASALATQQSIKAYVDSNSGASNVFSNQSGSAPFFGARAYISFKGTLETDNSFAGTIYGSGNIDSVTRSSAGKYTINFTTDLPNTNYIVIGQSNGDSSSRNMGGELFVISRAKATDSVDIELWREENEFYADSAVVDVVIFG